MIAAKTQDSKLDLTRERRQFFNAPRRPELVDLKAAQFLTIEGKGASGEGQPGHDDFQEAIQAIYAVAYGLKMRLKSQGQDFKVCTIQALWWTDNEGEVWQDSPENWRWKLMTMVPDYVEQAMVQELKTQQRQRHLDGTLARLRLERLTEGLCVQMLHVGPYATEMTTIDQMRAFMSAEGLAPAAVHEEIYLSNPQRTAPEKLKTILRQQVRRL